MIKLKTGKDVTRSAICHWEKGISNPSMENLLALTELFEVPLDYFFEPKPNYLLEAVTALQLFGIKSRDLARLGIEEDLTGSKPAPAAENSDAEQPFTQSRG